MTAAWSRAVARSPAGVPLRLFASRERSGAHVARFSYLGAMMGFWFVRPAASQLRCNRSVYRVVTDPWNSGYVGPAGAARPTTTGTKAAPTQPRSRRA